MQEHRPFCKYKLNQNNITWPVLKIYRLIYRKCYKCIIALIFLLMQTIIFQMKSQFEMQFYNCILFCCLVVITNYGPIKFMKVYVYLSNYNFMLIIPNLTLFCVRVCLSPLLLSLAKLIFFRFSLNSDIEHYI